MGLFHFPCPFGGLPRSKVGRGSWPHLGMCHGPVGMEWLVTSLPSSPSVHKKSSECCQEKIISSSQFHHFLS